MFAAFTNILTPVDFSTTTRVAVNKSMEVANTDGAEIYLLHVLPSACRHQPDVVDEKRAALLALIQEIDKPEHVKISCVLEFSDDVAMAITDNARSIHADLIVVGKASGHWLPFFNTVSAGELASVTGCPVLTVKPGALNARMKTVVVPVGDTVPHEKMRAVAALCRNQSLKIHLVTFLNGDNGANDYAASTLLQVYQWLKTTLKCQVEYAVLQGGQKARMLLNYANRVDADLLLLHPEVEVGSGWFRRSPSEALPPHSKLQVLAIQP